VRNAGASAGVPFLLCHFQIVIVRHRKAKTAVERKPECDQWQEGLALRALSIERLWSVSIMVARCSLMILDACSCRYVTDH
jgi:hypothetical protein